MKNMKTVTKRGLALFLAMTMCITLLPVQVFAAVADEVQDDEPVTASELENGDAEETDTEESDKTEDVTDETGETEGDDKINETPDDVEAEDEESDEAEEETEEAEESDETEDVTDEAGEPEAKYCDVTFMAEGSVVDTVRVEKGSDLAAAAAGVSYTPAGNLRKLVGWSKNSSSEDADLTGTVESDMTVYAVLGPAVWIQFNSDGGSYVDAVLADENGTITPPADPTRDGYAFDCWMDGENPVTSWTFEWSRTLTAKWNANTGVKYTVIYWKENANDDGYSYWKSETKAGIAGKQTDVAAGDIPVHFTAKTIEQQTIAGDGSTIVNVYYDREICTLSFYTLKANCGHTKHDKEKLTAECYNTTAAYTITGKYGRDIRSEEWPQDETTGSRWNVSADWGANYHLYRETLDETRSYFESAKDYSNAHTFYRYLYVQVPAQNQDAEKEYELYNTIEVVTNTEEPSVNYSEIPGYTLNSGKSTTKRDPETGKLKYDNGNFYEYFDLNTYKIEFYSGTGVVGTREVAYKAQIGGAIADPENGPAGYTFGGWYLDKECTTSADDVLNGTMPANNLIVYAKWEAPTYAVTVEGKDGIVTVKRGGTLTVEQWAEFCVDVKGPNFLGFIDKDTGAAFHPNTPITRNITLVANSRDATYHVTYNAGEGNTPPNDLREYMCGAKAVVMPGAGLTAPEGMEFDCWEAADGSTYQPGATVAVNGSVTLTAKWKPRTYKISYTLNVGTVTGNPEEYTVETESFTLNNPSKDGYTFTGWSGTGLDGVTENVTIAKGSTGDRAYEAHFTVNQYSYSVHYFYDKEEDNSLTAGGNADYGTQVTTYESKQKDGYKFASATAPLTIGTDATKNVINVYYVTDESQTKELSYTVEYYKDDVKVDADTQTEEQTVQVLQPDTLTVKTAEINTTDKYGVGYKFEKSEPATIPGTVNSGDVIKVYYVTDESKTQDTKYTVKHVVDGKEQADDTKTYTATAWINDAPAMIAIKAGSLAENKYTGYKFDKIDTEAKEGDRVVNGTVITLTYVKDESKTQDTKYTVNHVVDGEDAPRFTDEVKSTAWVLDDPAMIEVTAASVTAKVISGYKLDTATAKAGDKIESGSTVTLTYVKDESKTQNTEYTVEHVVAGEVRDSQKHESTAWVNDDPAMITIEDGSLDENEYTGYKFDSISVAEGTTEVESGTVITLTYVKRTDLSYAVNYHYGNATVTESGSNGVFGDEIAYDAPEITTYNGQSYVLERVEGAGKTIGVNADENVVDVYYSIDVNGDDVADRYQITVTYSVTNGSASFSSKVLTLRDTNGNLATADEGGSVKLTDVDVPTTSPTNNRYQSDGWDVSPVGMTLTADHSFTYTYRLPGGGGGGIITPDPDPVTPPTEEPTEEPTETIEDEAVPLAGAIGLNDQDHFAYIMGYEDDTVRPLANITRAEVATILFRLMTEIYRTINWSTTNDYADVNEGDWHNTAISTCTQAEIVFGYDDGTFKPNQAITRAEFAAFAANMLDGEYTGEGVEDFTDTVGHWAAEAIRRVVEAGWFQGENGLFRPDDPITRAEAVTVINRMLNRIVDKDHMLEDMKVWIDNPEGTWYYEAIQEASNEHDYERDDAEVETWTGLLPATDWKALEEQWAAENAPAEADETDADAAGQDSEA